MAKAASYKGLVRQFSLGLFILLGLYLALLRPIAQQGVNMLQAELDEAITQLERYIPQEDGIVPTEKSLKTLKAHLAQDEENYRMLKDFIDPPKEYVPKSTRETGLYFIEQLHITTKRLRRQANALKINLPESLGFSVEMPADGKNVEVLLKALDTADRIVGLLLEQGVEEISLVKPLRAIEQRDQKTQKLFYSELPLQLSFLCNSSCLVKFLYQIKNFSPVLLVKDVVIKRQDGASLKVEMLLTRIVI